MREEETDKSGEKLERRQKEETKQVEQDKDTEKADGHGEIGRKRQTGRLGWILTVESCLGPKLTLE